MQILIGIGVFITIILIIEGVYYAFITSKKTEKKKIKKRLKTLLTGNYQNKEIDIVRKRLLSEVSWFNRLLFSFPVIIKLHRLLEQANSRYTVGYYILLTIFLAVCGYLGIIFITPNYVFAFLVAFIAATIPFLQVYIQKRNRMLKFERQLPDAIDLLVRALKAGHAFSSGIRMVANEFADPIGTEFDKTMDEINFGVGISEALINLTYRVDCPDLKFLVISVIVQKETGGNLAEILDKISYLIRERFKLQGRVRVLSAEGKFSAVVLGSLPFLICLYMSLVNPHFLNPLLKDPVGNALIYGAILLMVLGIIVMKKMISIKV